MKCEACERGDHDNCGMQTWCDCDCAGPEAIGLPDPSDVVGHKTFDTGERDEHGLPVFRHEPLTREVADALWEACEAARKDRAARMPDENTALRAMHNAHTRLKELGWREGIYSPRDGTTFKVIELGSAGIFDCDCRGEWPDCTWTTYDHHDAYPSSQAPALFKLNPDDQAKYDARMAEAKARYAESRDRPQIFGRVTGKIHEGDQVPGMPGAICHACGLGYRCLDPDCPNTKTDPNSMLSA